MLDDFFYFKKFKVRNSNSALKVNTDGVLLGAWSNLNSGDKTLEIGTGSGVISLMLNQRFEKLDITAIDIDKLSYEEASFNVELNEASNIKVLHKSVQDLVSEDLLFDHIVSNPPYFQNSTKPKGKGLSLAKHNCDLTFSILWDSISKLSHERTLVSVILPFEESKEFIRIGSFKEFGLNRVLNIKPKESRPIKRVLLEFRNIKYCNLETCEMFMHKDGQHNYTEAYKNLTKDFYLAF